MYTEVGQGIDTGRMLYLCPTLCAVSDLVRAQHTIEVTDRAFTDVSSGHDHPLQVPRTGEKTGKVNSRKVRANIRLTPRLYNVSKTAH